MKSTNNKSKNKMIKTISKFLEEKANQVSESKGDIEDKIYQMNVVLDTLKFLKDYDKNVEILNKYYYDNKYKENNTKGEDDDGIQQH